ncbi:MAG: N-acetylmuramoyl-L-alanine amidase [Bacteroidaceae bacterium]|nr:N-acetylmuramoyl-L-alanine amidase [Bacteroidaceae bacterium]
MKRALLTIFFTCAALAAMAGGNAFVLCIDPGHGGHDAGAVGLKGKEKDINLTVALAFGKMVEQRCKDVKVVYTRKTDVYITLQGRADIANAARADLFISVHTNSVEAGSPLAYGCETYCLGQRSLGTNYSVVQTQGRVVAVQGGKQRQETYDPSRAESLVAFDLLHAAGMEQGALLAQCIQRQYTRAGRPDKGVKAGEWLVLRRTVMPAVLTELGFISTPAEEDYLLSEAGAATLARCLYNGFVEYRNAIDHQRRKLVDLNPAPSPRPQAGVTGGGTQAQQSVVQQPQQPAQQQKHQQQQQQQAHPQRPARQQQQQQQQPQRPARQQHQQQQQHQQPQRPARQQQQQQQQSAQAKPKVCFKVQLLSSAKPLKADDPQFKGVKPVEEYREGNAYKYTTDTFENVADARKLKGELAEKFPGAFVVAFIDGKRVSVQEAIEAQKATTR